MDQQISEIAYFKGQTSTNEPQKRKKYERKKNVIKPGKLPLDFVETAYPGKQKTQTLTLPRK
jgi:hypothetical protein